MYHQGKKFHSFQLNCYGYSIFKSLIKFKTVKIATCLVEITADCCFIYICHLHLLFPRRHIHDFLLQNKWILCLWFTHKICFSFVTVLCDSCFVVVVVVSTKSLNASKTNSILLNFAVPLVRVMKIIIIHAQHLYIQKVILNGMDVLCMPLHVKMNLSTHKTSTLFWYFLPFYLLTVTKTTTAITATATRTTTKTTIRTKTTATDGNCYELCFYFVAAPFFFHI